MTDWKTLKEVAEELGVSKDLVKYHRKNLDVFQLEKVNEIFGYPLQELKKFVPDCEKKAMMQPLKKKSYVVYT